MIRNFFRHLWESIKSLKRNVWMTIASVSSVTITLTLVGVFAAVLLNVERIATGIENNIQINVYLDVDSTDSSETTTNEAGETVANDSYHQVYDQISKVSGVESVTYSSKDEQLEKLQQTYGDDWSLFDGDSNPLQDVYIVEADSPSDVKKVAKKIADIEGVESVDYGGSNSDQLFSIAKFIRTWGFAGTILLVVVAIFLISNTIRMTIMSRQRDIEIMRLVGAKNSYIRGPFFFEGAWVGLLGAIVPSIIIYFAYKTVYSSVNPQFEVQGLSLYPIDTFLPLVIGGMFLVGIIIGALGSVISMRRYLKI
ncbi:cell division protein FtsX [Streptococcus gallolyticus]|uniref:Cell division protein FtsX n=1 Tax=Streptococcus gallolyticus TaxID=315405 RepID=A0A1H7V6Y3_9STRE|nr:permease-like cell division protein FtsX [Streptococcus gallolyticus]MCY7154550.1 permease-like cell division protein FtsX [Streptococcus gallolyticus subsp. gallolyticus]MCY7173557.1 permease-like cell division protein FtsX [Streptococcus gallolyticus subsp. gallolyticus]MCY7175679.1 permease-like cell division protein FtsX [Streptococcus gallolyticus subsp. gallolyticus]MCY7180133.1 permease-like cell division protein FtsX [Streptococcus gallolyticus subsp. gallolyticus]MCY7186813.1 perme